MRTQISSGSYRPVQLRGRWQRTRSRPPPRLSSGNVNLSTFDGMAANGTWNLWVVDDENLDMGSIASWSLTITTTGPPPPPPPPPPRLRHRLRHRHRPATAAAAASTATSPTPPPPPPPPPAAAYRA